MFTAISAVVFVVAAVNALNGLPAMAAGAKTDQPLALQIGIAITGSLVFGLFISLALGLIAGLVAPHMGMAGRRGQTPRPLLIGGSIGVFMAGAGALARHVAPSFNPVWGNLGPASEAVPLLGTALGPILGYFIQTLVLLALVYGLARWTRAPWIWILTGFALAGASGIETMTGWLILGLSTALVLVFAYLLVFRQQPEVIIITTVTLVVLSTLRDGVQRAYPVALPGAIMGIVIAVVVAALWYKGIRTVGTAMGTLNKLTKARSSENPLPG
jgi:hypothetical protein